LSSPETASSETATEEQPEAEPTDELREGLVARLREELGDGVLDHHIRPGDDVWVRVDRTSWRRAGEVARDALACDYFCFLSGLDWLPSPYGRGEDDPTEPPVERSTEVVQGYAGGETRFQVFARVESTSRHYGITFKADLPDDDLSVDSWVPVYHGAEWHERETWEMYGFDFTGHPDPRHIYLPTDFEGFPLRKDYPLIARMVKPWPGIVDVEAMPAGDDEPTEGEAAADEVAQAEAAEGAAT
jgi:NADH-quinone oxidoreductase subunit C